MAWAVPGVASAHHIAGQQSQSIHVAFGGPGIPYTFTFGPVHQSGSLGSFDSGTFALWYTETGKKTTVTRVDQECQTPAGAGRLMGVIIDNPAGFKDVHATYTGSVSGTKEIVPTQPGKDRYADLTACVVL